MVIHVIIPAYNEEDSIGRVIQDLPKPWWRHNRTSLSSESSTRALMQTLEGPHRTLQGSTQHRVTSTYFHRKIMIIDVIIPAYNEEASIGKVIQGLPKEMIRDIIVCDNGSSDLTGINAVEAGAFVVSQPDRGYGNACLAGIDFLEQNATVPPDMIVFIDGDYSDFPEEMSLLVQPIIDQQADLVIGSRVLGNTQTGSMTIPQRFGNWLATHLVRMLYGYHFTDLGPFRAIRWQSLLALDMHDKTYGWTVEMQVKAAKMKLRCTEIPVSYRKRIGQSKVSGTIKGTFMAGYKILWTIFKLI